MHKKRNIVMIFNSTLAYPRRKIPTYAIVLLLVFTVGADMNAQNQFLSNDNFSYSSERSIGWNVTLIFNVSSGMNDSVVFGEADNATDGPPPDYWDQPKPSPPAQPYVYAWFNDSLPNPYDKLLKDYRHYPDSYKVWNLSILWVPESGHKPTKVTISWDPDEVDTSEYDSKYLCNSVGTPIRDMASFSNYSFNCPANNQRDFKIIFSITELPNQPPSFGTPNPANNSANQNLSLNWSIDINDTDGDAFNWWINCSNGQSSSFDDSRYIGASATSETDSQNFEDDIIGIPWNMTTGIDAQASNISIRIGLQNTAHKVRCALYDSNKLLIAETEERTITVVGTNWQTFNFSEPRPVLESDVTYYICAFINSTIGHASLSWDNTTGDDSGAYIQQGYGYDIHGGNFPNDWSSSVPWGTQYGDPTVHMRCYYITVYNGTKTLNLTGLSHSTEYTVWVNATDSYNWTKEWYTFNTHPVYYNYSVPLDVKWNLFSLPVNQSVNKSKIIVNYLGTNYTWQEAVSNTIVLDFIYSWNATTQYYMTTNILDPGEGYWIYVYDNCTLWISSNTSNNDDYITALIVKWNLIGLPYDIPVDNENLTIYYNGTNYTWQDAVNNNIILDFIYEWNETSQYYEITDILEPGAGYWIYAYNDCTLLHPTG